MLTALFIIITILILLPSMVVLVQVLASFLKEADEEHMGEQVASCVVLVPAHNEAAGIEYTIRSVSSQLAPGDRILVVADNCSDDTAALARQAGAEVVERFDDELRGKGYALDFGINCLETAPPNILVIVDADCVLTDRALPLIKARCMTSGRPVQALYLMNPAADSGLEQKVAALAWILKNRVRPLGFHKLGLPCQLMGTGMAFPWRVFDFVSLANGHLVEDMKAGIDMAIAGYPPLFCHEALVESTFPTAGGAVKTQRTRWEHGHLSAIGQYVPPLLGHGLKSGRPVLFAMAFDLAVPPLALLVILTVISGGMNTLLWLFTGSVLPLALTLLGVSALSLALLLTWYGWGRQVIRFSELLSIPFYVLRKLTVYAGFLFKRQTRWIRTDRD